MSSRPTLKDKQAASESTVFEFDENDHLALDPEIKAEITAKGLEWRWINAKKHKESYGFDPRGWAPYKREAKNATGVSSFGYTDSEGHVRRGDLILAVLPKHVMDKKREKIKNKNERLAKEQRKMAASQIQDQLGKAGKIYEGYDEN